MSNLSTKPTNAELEALVREATEAVTPFKSGRLVSTPLSHLVAYLHKHSMSGTLWLHDVGHDSTVLFADGSPCKVRTSLEVPRLGAVLVGMGVIRQRAYDETIHFALKGGGLHGGMLVACGLLDQRGLEIGLRNQIGLQLLAIFRTAAPSTWFAFYRDTDLLASWGGPELTPIDPWWLLWRGNREIAPDAPVWAIVQRLSSERLVLRDDVDADRFGFEPDERSLRGWRPCG